MPMDFLDISANRRLVLFTKMLSLISQSSDEPATIYRSLLVMMRQAFDMRCYVEVSTEGLKPGYYRLTRVWCESGAEKVDDHSPWRIDDVPVRHGGVVGELITRAEPGAVNRLVLAPDDPVYPELREYQSVAAAPGGLGEFHNWVLVLDREPDAFTAEDVEVLVLRVNLIGQSLKNLKNVAELRSAKSVIDAEVDRIAEIQRSLLPTEFPNVPGLEVAAKFETFDRAGGDLYDFTQFPGGRWGFMVADASGHGPSAAVVSAMLDAILHTLPVIVDGREIAPSQVLQYANAQMAARRIEQSFVTAILCTWDPKQQTLSYARAGHQPPLLRREGKVIPLDQAGELPLGIFEETTYTQAVQKLQAGDVVVIFTDGISEAMNSAGEMFGEEGMTRVLIEAGNSAEAVLHSIWNAVVDHQGGSTSRDDQTVLVLRVTS